MEILMQRTTEEGIQVQVQSRTPWDDNLKHGQVATRQQTTEVRCDNVATAQVRHHDPEPRPRVLLSNATSRRGKAIAIYIIVDLSRKEVCRS